jgi:putative Mn2+ efflux pump MntP
MLEIFIASLSLAVFHALIPNHWIPLVTIAKAESWSLRESLGVTALTGLAHSTGTIAIGLALGYIGIQISNQFELFTELVAPLIIIVMGLVYLFFTKGHTHNHLSSDIQDRRSKTAIIIALTLSMFLSPCLEMETYFLVAAKEGWPGLALVSSVFLIATTAVMLILVYLGFQSLKNMHWEFLEHHEKKITGVILILIGLVTLVLHYNHWHFH